MALKKELKDSEARILVYLSNVIPPLRCSSMISIKLGIQYTYVRRLLREMVYKKYILEIPKRNKLYYEINDFNILNKAIEMRFLGEKYTEEPDKEQIKLSEAQ